MIYNEHGTGMRPCFAGILDQTRQVVVAQALAPTRIRFSCPDTAQVVLRANCCRTRRLSLGDVCCLMVLLKMNLLMGPGDIIITTRLCERLVTSFASRWCSQAGAG